LQRKVDFQAKWGSQETLKRQSCDWVIMKIEVSAKEELEKINAEISKLERCKKVLEDILSFELLKH
jgi:hypothetical protein